MANKYTFNKDYFERIDSKDKAYFLGFLYADGCNSISILIQINLLHIDQNGVIIVYNMHS